MTRTRNDPEVLRLTAEANCDPRTVLRVFEGKPVRVLAEKRIREAADKLKIKLPVAKTKAKKTKAKKTKAKKTKVARR